MFPRVEDVDPTVIVPAPLTGPFTVMTEVLELVPKFIVKVPLTTSAAQLCEKTSVVKLVPEPIFKVPPIVNPTTPVALVVPVNSRFPVTEVVPVCNVFVLVPPRPRFA